jgi:hypothetical protein
MHCTTWTSGLFCTQLCTLVAMATVKVCMYVMVELMLLVYMNCSFNLYIGLHISVIGKHVIVVIYFNF